MPTPPRCVKQDVTTKRIPRDAMRDAKTGEDKQDLLELAGVWTRKLPYIVDPDGPVRAIAPCAEAEGAGLRPTRSPFAKRLLIAEVPIGASRIAQRYERSLSERSEVRVSALRAFARACIILSIQPNCGSLPPTFWTTARPEQ